MRDYDEDKRDEIIEKLKEKIQRLENILLTTKQHHDSVVAKNSEEIQRLQNQLNNARIKLTEFMDTKKPQTAFEKLTALETVLKDYKSQDNV